MGWLIANLNLPSMVDAVAAVAVAAVGSSGGNVAGSCATCLKSGGGKAVRAVPKQFGMSELR